MSVSTFTQRSDRGHVSRTTTCAGPTMVRESTTKVNAAPHIHPTGGRVRDVVQLGWREWVLRSLSPLVRALSGKTAQRHRRDGFSGSGLHNRGSSGGSVGKAPHLYLNGVKEACLLDTGSAWTILNPAR